VRQLTPTQHPAQLNMPHEPAGLVQTPPEQVVPGAQFSVVAGYEHRPASQPPAVPKTCRCDAFTHEGAGGVVHAVALHEPLPLGPKQAPTPQPFAHVESTDVYAHTPDVASHCPGAMDVVNVWPKHTGAGGVLHVMPMHGSPTQWPAEHAVAQCTGADANVQVPRLQVPCVEKTVSVVPSLHVAAGGESQGEAQMLSPASVCALGNRYERSSRSRHAALMTQVNRSPTRRHVPNREFTTRWFATARPACLRFDAPRSACVVPTLSERFTYSLDLLGFGASAHFKANPEPSNASVSGRRHLLSTGLLE
jgi:hypothetical protein